MWKKTTWFAVGNLREIGFKSESDFLMVLSGQGRGIFDCLTCERIERDRSDYYSEKWDPDTGLVDGFGQFEDEYFLCGGFEAPNPLNQNTNDGWSTIIQKTLRADYRGQILEAEVLFLFHALSNTRIEVMSSHYGYDRAWGFSSTGKSFVYACSSDLHIFNRIA